MLTLLLAASLAVAAPSDTTIDRWYETPGVARELAEWRAARITNVRYDLQLDVTGRSAAPGRVVIQFDLAEQSDVILDWRGLRLGDARVNGRLGKVAANGSHIRVPASLLRAGRNTVDIGFAAAIAPSGASIIHFRDRTDGADYLYTLLVPSDAHALFPSFDQPDLKARVILTLTTRRGWSAVANAPLANADSTERAIVWRFVESQPISTYLIAFAAGPWTRIASTVASRPMTMYVRASRAADVEADSLFRLNAEALDWLERYFDRPYPFDKYDFVLAPAFPFGGMEHPGAVFYNEEQFIFRERPTLPQRLGRTATIYHEVAHQWFGDLVTMRWFDDLWLKEGFATYMAAKMQAELDPGSQAWKTFYVRNKPSAASVDVTEGTTPVWQALANLEQAKSNYGAIVYNKAPSVLKQLNHVVGDSAFRSGVRAFLANHAYGNATWRDLLAAIGGAAGQSLDQFGSQYILRPGIPILEQRLEITGGRLRSVTLNQRPARDLSGPEPWPIATQVIVGWRDRQPLRLSVMMDSAETRVPIPPNLPAPAFVFSNDADHAYALPLLDERSLAWVETNIATVEDALLRAQLWGSMWDLVREARMAPERFIAAAVRAIPTERDEQILGVLLTRAIRANDAYLSAAQRERLRPELESMLVSVADDDRRPYGIRKAHLDAFIGVAASASALVRIDAILDDTVVVGAPLRSPTRWAIITALMANGAPTAERRLVEEALRDSTTEGQRRAFVAGAARRDSASKAEYFTRFLGDATLNEDWVTASLRAFNLQGQSGLTRPHLGAALDALPWIQRNRRIFFLVQWVSAFIEGQSDPEALRIVEQHLTRADLPLDLRQKILQSSDELQRTVTIRSRFAGGTAAAGD